MEESLQLKCYPWECRLVYMFDKEDLLQRETELFQVRTKTENFYSNTNLVILDANTS